MLRKLLGLSGKKEEAPPPSVPKTGPYDPERDPYIKLKNDLGDLLGDLMQFWGFGRPLGRIWAWLYLTPSPLTAKELQSSLSLSAGAVSMALKELKYWGVIKTLPQPGRKADQYTAETNILPVIIKVFREREMEFIQRALRVIEAAEQAVKETPGDKDLRAFFQYRLGRLMRLARMGQQLLSALLQLRSPDFEAIHRNFQL